MPEFVNHPRGPSGERVVSGARMIMLGSVDTSRDMNVASGAPYWDGIEYAHPDWEWGGNIAGASNARLYANFNGAGWFTANLEITTPSVQRANLRVRIQKNGAGYLLGAGAMGYIRFASGHDVSSIYIRAFDPNIQDGDYYWVRTNQYAAAGTVTCIADGSYFAAERVA